MPAASRGRPGSTASDGASMCCSEPSGPWRPVPPRCWSSAPTGRSRARPRRRPSRPAPPRWPHRMSPAARRPGSRGHAASWPSCGRRSAIHRPRWESSARKSSGCSRNWPRGRSSRRTAIARSRRLPLRWQCLSRVRQSGCAALRPAAPMLAGARMPRRVPSVGSWRRRAPLRPGAAARTRRQALFQALRPRRGRRTLHRQRLLRHLPAPVVLALAGRAMLRHRALVRRPANPAPGSGMEPPRIPASADTAPRRPRPRRVRGTAPRPEMLRRARAPARVAARRRPATGLLPGHPPAAARAPAVVQEAPAPGRPAAGRPEPGMDHPRSPLRQAPARAHRPDRGMDPAPLAPGMARVATPAAAGKGRAPGPVTPAPQARGMHPAPAQVQQAVT